MSGLTRRALGAAAPAGLVTLALGLRASAQPAADPVEALLHPELRSLAPALRRMQAAAGPAKLPRRPAASPPLVRPGVEPRFVPGRRGAPEVLVYVVNRREGGAPRPAILHIHGGGFIGGDARGGLSALQRLASSLDCVIVTVEYRLAPETRFPGSLEDNYAALAWLHRNAASLGVDATRVALLGESAGGGHAAMLAIAARDRGEFPVAFQALVYPMLDDRTGSVRKVPPHIGTYIWTAEHNRLGWNSLLGLPAGGRRTPYGAAPARVENLAGLPPAFIGVGTLDLFVDEDIDYARRLVQAGVSTELLVVPGAFHGFELMAPNTAVARRFKAALETALAGALRPAAA
jgi:acetyl esterase/lipase